MARYLADTSIWGWANSGKRPDIQAKLAERFGRAEVVTCAPVFLEVMHRARGRAEYEQLAEGLFAPLDWLPLTNEIATRACEVQRELAARSHGNHLRPAIDYLIAAVAEAAGDDVVLWAFDRDLRLISKHTGQPIEGERSAGAAGR